MGDAGRGRSEHRWPWRPWIRSAADSGMGPGALLARLPRRGLLSGHGLRPRGTYIAADIR